jgi:hypothetical protein
MAKPGPKKKRERKDNGQLPLPTSRTSAACSETRVLPMQLQIGDRLADETGEWEVASRPYVTNAGKDAHVRVKKVGQPDVTELRTWGADERVAVRRASTPPASGTHGSASTACCA